MPEMSGPEATQAIRQLGGDKETLPVIAVTADVMEDHIQQYFKAGMNAFATKPIDHQALLLTINDVLGEEVHVAAPAADSPTKAAPSPPDGDETDSIDSEEVSEDVADFLDALNTLSAE